MFGGGRRHLDVVGARGSVLSCDKTRGRALGWYGMVWIRMKRLVLHQTPPPGQALRTSQQVKWR